MNVSELSYIEQLILSDVGPRTEFGDTHADKRWAEYDSLARRVIAAEKLVQALQTARDYVSDAHIGALVYDDGKRVSETMTTEDISLIDAALTVYEATK